jgi:hypothetical protein
MMSTAAATCYGVGLFPSSVLASFRASSTANSRMYAVTERPAARAWRDNRSTSRAMPFAFVAGSCRQNSTSLAMTPTHAIGTPLLKFTPNELTSQTLTAHEHRTSQLAPVEGAESSSVLTTASRYYPACSGGLPLECTGCGLAVFSLLALAALDRDGCVLHRILCASFRLFEFLRGCLRFLSQPCSQASLN